MNPDNLDSTKILNINNIKFSHIKMNFHFESFWSLCIASITCPWEHNAFIYYFEMGQLQISWNILRFDNISSLLQHKGGKSFKSSLESICFVNFYSAYWQRQNSEDNCLFHLSWFLTVEFLLVPNFLLFSYGNYFPFKTGVHILK